MRISGWFGVKDDVCSDPDSRPQGRCEAAYATTWELLFNNRFISRRSQLTPVGHGTWREHSARSIFRVDVSVPGRHT